MPGCRDAGNAPSPTDPSRMRGISLGSPSLREESFRKSAWVWDSVRLTSNTHSTFDIRVPFPVTGQGRPPERHIFGAQYTAQSSPCELFDGRVAHPDASLEAQAIGATLRLLSLFLIFSNSVSLEAKAINAILPGKKRPFTALSLLSLTHPVPFPPFVLVASARSCHARSVSAEVTRRR